MKVKNLNICFAIVIAILFASCGGGKSDKGTTSVTVKPKTTVIKGDLGDYFEVINQDYIIKVDENSFLTSGLISVEVKRNDKDFAFPTENINPFGTNGSEDYHVGFGIELFGDAGSQVIKNATEGGMGGPYSSEDVTGLMKLKKGETGYIRWSVDELEGLKTFQLSSAIEKSEHSSYSGSDGDNSSDNSSVSSSGGTEDWDAVLKSYESYIDQYIKLMKKAKNGDASAITEYASMMEKATDLATKMQNAGDDLSSTQMAKFVKLQTKLANAALEMQ